MGFLRVLTVGDGVDFHLTPLCSLECNQHFLIADEQLATRTSRIRLDEERRAEQEAPRQHQPSPEFMAEDSAPMRPPESIPYRSGAIGMETARSVFGLPSARNRGAGFLRGARGWEDLVATRAR